MPAHPFALIILILGAYRQNASCYKFDDIKRLKQNLLTSHDGDIQPRVDQNEQIKVKIIFYLTMLQDLNEREQKFTMLGYFNVSWWDEYLQWNADDYNGIPSVHLRVDKVWQPGIALVNPASDLESKGWGFESHCGQGIFHFVFCRFRRAPVRSTGPMQMKSSLTSIRVI